MTDVLNSSEVIYKTPSHSAFHYRKIFHAIEKKPNEELEQWFCRIQTAIIDCDFGNCTNFMLIDKFISGLSEKTFEKYSETSTLGVEQLLSIASADPFALNNSFVSTKFEPIEDIDELLSLEIVEQNISNADDFDGDDDGDDDGDARSNDEGASDEEERTKRQTIDESEKIHNYQTEEVNYQISNCTESVDNPFEFEVKGFQIDAQKRIVCLDCDKVFVLKSSYNLHKRIHTGINLHQCKICDKIFTTRSKLKRHMSTHDNDGRTFDCYLCPFKFDQFHALRIHFNMKHLRSKKDEVQCTICQKIFLSQNALDRHLKIHQGLSHVHKCLQCNKEFDERWKLKEHQHVHSDFKQFICESCGHAFKTRKQLKMHSRRHSVERPFKCMECGQHLKSSFSYKNHMRLHTGERPFMCELCQKTFVQRANLMKHLMVHRKEKPHACSVCEKKFATVYHLKIHKSVHTGEKPYRCKQCEKSFTQLGTLKSHIKRFHLDVAPN